MRVLLACTAAGHPAEVVMEDAVERPPFTETQVCLCVPLPGISDAATLVQGRGEGCRRRWRLNLCLGAL